MKSSAIALSYVIAMLAGPARAAELFNIPLRINMGGIETVDSYGRTWLGDGPGPIDPLNIRPDDTGGTNWIENWNGDLSIPDSFIALGYDPQHEGDRYLFTTIRWDDGGDNLPDPGGDPAVAGSHELRLELPVPNGQYQISLYFNEACCTGRHFKVMAQGEVKLDDVSYLSADPTNPSPPLNTLYRLTVPGIQVTDQILKLAFLPCGLDTCAAAFPTDSNAIIDAIEVLGGDRCDNQGLDFNCALVPETGAVLGTWSSIPEAEGYQILRNGAPMGPDRPRTNGEFSDPSPVDARNFMPIYTLQVLKGGSVITECRCSVKLATCPRDLSCAVLPGTGEATLSWTAALPVELVTAYEVRRDGVLVKTLGGDAATYSDTFPGRFADYEVTPVSGGFCGAMACRACNTSVPFAIPLRINMGGKEAIDSHGDTWLGDGPGPGDRLCIRSDVLGGAQWIESWGGAGYDPTPLDALGFDSTSDADRYIFDSIRWDVAGDPQDFRMEIQVPDGDYLLNLYFTEECCLQRHFKIEAQGSILDDDVSYVDYDPIDQLLHRTGRLSFDGVRVEDGSLRLNLLPCPECPCAGCPAGTILDNNAIVSALELLPSQFGSVSRVVEPSPFKAGETVKVSIRIEKISADAPVLVQEVLPAGFTASEVSDGAVAAAGGIDWSFPGGFLQKTLTYKLTPLDCAGDLVFPGSSWTSGTVSGKVLGEQRADRALEDGTLGVWTRSSVGVSGDRAAALGERAVQLNGTGLGVRLSADEFSFVHFPGPGGDPRDFELSARIDCVNGPKTSQVGLQMRESIDPYSAFAAFALSPNDTGGGTLKGYFRHQSGIDQRVGLVTIKQNSVPSLPIYLKMARVGGTLTLSRSSDGLKYDDVGTKDFGTASSQINLPGDFLLGLTASSGGGGSVSAIFREVGGPSFATVPPPVKTFRRGDTNADGKIDVSDPVILLQYLFLAGEGPVCPDAADSDDNGLLDISDAVINLNYQFLAGNPPADPGPAKCGPDPIEETPDLGCGVSCAQ